MHHELKTWKKYFAALWEGTKNFELRKDDRNFENGDLLTLKEYDFQKGEYTGREISARVSYKLEDCDAFGLKKGFCILGLEHLIRFRR